jgi:hypothetical protein
MKLILDHSRRHYHVSRDNTSDFELEILSDPRLRPLSPAAAHLSRGAYYFLRLLEKTGGSPGLILRGDLSMRSPVRIKDDLFCIMLGLELRKAMPLAFSSGKKYVYLLDAWPSIDEQFIELIHGWRIDGAFIQSSQSVERLRKKESNCQFTWLPEGAEPDTFHFLPYENKGIDILEFGRKYDRYHDCIVESLERAGKVHWFERIKGEIIFPTKDDFLDGLARARISICFPSSLTHPEWSGGMEPLTGRYLQSMLSKCLIVGQSPQDLTDLFGYTPVVEIDWRDPDGQLLDILNHFEEYIPLIEKNYQEARSKHTWKQRWQQIAGMFFPK